MKVAIFSGGEFENVTPFSYDKLICADKGYLYALKLNLTPNYIIGDFDSYTNIPSGAEVYPKDKDYSDTHLAIDKAISIGATEIDLYFALGGRLDHLLFNVNLLKYASDKGVKLNIISKDYTASLIKGNVKFNASVNKTVSLVPFSDTVRINSSTGLKYEINNIIVKKGETLTLSNVAISSEVELEIESGELILVNFL